MSEKFQHQPVLLREAVDALAVKADGVYIDGTFGRGGHALEVLALLGNDGRLIAFDQDPEAVRIAEDRFADDKRFEIVHSNYSHMAQHIKDLGLMGKVDGILLDLGVSSPQFDDASRGFSFSQPGPLDMRMNPQQGQSAAEWLAEASDREIAQVLKRYGEERFAKRIAAAIVTARQQQTINNTAQLANIIASAVPKKQQKKIHPATQSFQAIRIFINRELDVLEETLAGVNDLLTIGGRLVVISFHSLEDRIVKRYMKSMSRESAALVDIPIRAADVKTPMRLVGKAVKASLDELSVNPRARSAVMRVAERVH